MGANTVVYTPKPSQAKLTASLMGANTVVYTPKPSQAKLTATPTTALTLGWRQNRRSQSRPRTRWWWLVQKCCHLTATVVNKVNSNADT
jgi:hypothetical protein